MPLRPFSSSLRAESVAISAEIPSPLTGEGQGEGEIPPPSNSLPPWEGESAGIAEPVPSKTRNPAPRNDISRLFIRGEAPQ